MTVHCGKEVEMCYMLSNKCRKQSDEWSNGPWSGVSNSLWIKQIHIFFARKKIGAEVQLYLYEKVIKRVESFKFLGVWFDARLTWRVHIDSVVSKCKKVINVMRCLAGTEWGADRAALRTLYIGLIRSVLDYGYVAYGSASKSVLAKLDKIQAEALRICSGAFKTTSVPALQVEMGEMPLELRRQQIMMTYWANLQGHTNHPTSKAIEPCWEHEKSPSKSFGWVLRETARGMGLLERSFSPSVVLAAIPPWLLSQPHVDLKLLDYVRDESGGNCEIVSSYIRRRYYSWLQIYTDGSKDPKTGRTAAAVVIPEFDVINGNRLTNNISVFVCEIAAMVVALQWVEEVRPQRAVVLSDSPYESKIRQLQK